MIQSNVFLVGPMGAGKSTVGKYLADFLHFDFYDSDTEIEQSTGANVSWIFDKEGEAGFRKREEKAIHHLCQLDSIVLATGGGAVISPQNRKVLKAHGQVVYLKASADVLIKRTRKDRNRPLLQTDNPAKVIRDLLAERDAFYTEIANLIVHTRDISAKDMAKKIMHELAQL